MASKELTDLSKQWGQESMGGGRNLTDTSTSMQTEFNSSFAPNEKTIMGAYKESKAQIEKASKASAGIIANDYGGAEQDALRQGEQSLYSAREAGGGFASSPLALSLISEATDKRIRSLQKEKNSLLMQNEYDKASQLSKLIIDEQTALTNARTTALNEYFGFKGEARAQAGEVRADRQLSIQEQQNQREQLAFRTPEELSILNLASQYPDANILPTDDFATVENKIKQSPTYLQNREKGNLELEAARANIAETQANTRYIEAQRGKVLSDVKNVSGNTVTFTTTEGTTKEAQVSDITKAIMNGTGSLKDLTPTDKATVLSEMSNIGYNPKQNLVTRMAGLLDLWDKISDDKKGPVEGRLYSIGGYGASSDPAIAKFESARIPLTREVARLYDVGMLSDQDVADYKSAMPSLNDSSRDAAAAKLGGLTTAMISSISTLSSTTPKEGDTKEWMGKTFIVKGGKWVLK